MAGRLSETIVLESPKVFSWYISGTGDPASQEEGASIGQGRHKAIMGTGNRSIAVRPEDNRSILVDCFATMAHQARGDCFDVRRVGGCKRSQVPDVARYSVESLRVRSPPFRMAGAI